MGKTVQAYLASRKISHNEQAKLMIGKSIRIIGCTSGHNYGAVGSIVKIYCWNNNNGGYVQINQNYSSIMLADMEILPQTIAELLEEKELNDKAIAGLQQDKLDIDSKIAFMKENNVDEYDEELYKVTQVLKKLDDGSLTGIERAKAIASIIKG